MKSKLRLAFSPGSSRFYLLLLLPAFLFLFTYAQIMAGKASGTSPIVGVNPLLEEVSGISININTVIGYGRINHS